MSIFQNKVASTLESQILSCQEHLQPETLDTKNSSPVISASPTSFSVFLSVQSLERSSAAKRVEEIEETHGRAEASLEEQQSQLAFGCPADDSLPTEQQHQQHTATLASTADQSQPGGTPCDSDSKSSQVVAAGSMEPVNEGGDWKGARATDSSVSAEDAEDIPLDGNRGFELAEKAVAPEFTRAPSSEKIRSERGRATTAAGEKGKVGFRWRRRQGGKQQEDCGDKSSGADKREVKLASPKSSSKDYSPEGAFLNALARWKLMFLPMKDWEDERKARWTVVSRLLGQLTGALAAVSADSNVSTACMLRLLQTRTKATFDYTRSMQQSCILISRRYRRSSEAGNSDFHSSSRSASTSRVGGPSAIRASETGMHVFRHGTDFDSSCCSGILFTSPAEDCSAALVVGPELPSCTRTLNDSARHELVASSSSVTVRDASYVGTRNAGNSQHPSRVMESLTSKDGQKRSDAVFRTLSASRSQTQNDADSLSTGNRGGNRERDANTRSSGANSSSAAREERKKPMGRRRAASAKVNSPRAESRLATQAAVQREDTGGGDKALGFEMNGEYVRGDSRLSRTLRSNDGEPSKDREQCLQGDVGVYSGALRRSTTNRSRKALKEKKGTWRFGKPKSVPDSATLTPGTALFSRFSIRPWVLLLLKMTQRSSLHLEALELSEESCLLQETLRVLRSDYERAANAQLNAVRKRALDAGTAHQSCCTAWKAYEQAFEDSARVAINTCGMSLQLPSQHMHQSAGRASSMLGLTTGGSAVGNPSSCTWQFERKYVIAAKKAQEQELEHVREVLRAVIALEDLERWRYYTLREHMMRFFSKVRQCLTTICSAVDFYLFDVLEGSTTLARRGTSSSGLRLGSHFMIQDSLCSEPSMLTLMQQQSLGQWSGTGEQPQQEQQEEEQQQRGRQQASRTSWLCGTNTGTAGRRSPWTKHLRPQARGRDSLSSAAGAASAGTSAARTAAAAASATPVRAPAALSTTRVRSISGTQEVLCCGAEAEGARASETAVRARQAGRRPRQLLQHARSAGFDGRYRGFSTSTASRFLSRAASSPVLGDSRSSAAASTLASALLAAGAASPPRRKKTGRGGSRNGTYKSDFAAETTNTQVTGNPTSSTSASSNSSSNGATGTTGSSAAVLADDGDREEALMAAALSSAAAADEESSSEGTDARDANESPATLLQQTRFSIDRASAPAGAHSSSEERAAADWEDSRLSEAAGAAEENAGSSSAESQNVEERTGEGQGEEGDPEEPEEEEEADTDEYSEELPALQSVPSSNAAFSPTAAYIDLWWLLRRCELLRETGGKVPPCLCNSSIVKIAKHLRYPAIPASVTLLKSEPVQRLSSAGPPFSHPTEQWKDGYLLLTWDRFLFMFRDQEAAMSGESSFLWTAFLPGAEVRRIKREQTAPAIVEVREKRRRFSLRRTSVSFRPLTDRACEEWVTTLRGVTRDSVFLSAAADRGGVACLSFEKLPPRVSCDHSWSGKIFPALHTEVLSDSAPVTAKDSDAPSCNMAARGAADTHTATARLPSVSLASPKEGVWYEDGRRGGRVSSPLSALVSIDETSSSAESEVRSSPHTLESGPQQRSGSIEGSLMLISHRTTKTDEDLFTDRVRTEYLPVVGTTGAPVANSTSLPTLKACDTSAAAAGVAADAASGAAGDAAAGGITNP